MFHKTVIVTAVLLPFYALANPTEWPKLVEGKVDNDICTEALRVAEQYHKSNNFNIYQLRDPKIQLESNRVFGAKNNDGQNIYEEKDLFFDKNIFQKSGQETRNLYWQMHSLSGFRYVIEESFGHL